MNDDLISTYLNYICLIAIKPEIQTIKSINIATKDIRAKSYGSFVQW